VAETDRAHVRLAELAAALSLGIDLGFGQPMEHVLRQCLIALRLGERIGLDEERRAVVYYTALLVGVGCHTDAHEQAKWFGDDFALKATKYEHKLQSAGGALATVKLLGSGNPAVQRFRVGLEFAISGHRDLGGMIEHHSRMARALGEQLGLPEAVLESLGAAYEQWDGRGWPGRLSAADVPVASRIAQLAEYVEVAHRVGGVKAAQDLARDRRGKQFDPALADLVCADGELILAGLDTVESREAVVAAEPAPAVVLAGERFDAALASIANFIDLKSPYFLGHSVAVAELVAEAGRLLGLPDSEVLTLSRAGLVHDFGRLGISNGIWDKPRRLGAGEWERVRLHPCLTERMLGQSEALAPLGAIAVQHRERLDGSGYPRGVSGAAISRAARLLGAADAYQAIREPRPHRAARSTGEAANPPARRGESRALRRRRRRGGARRRRPSRPAPWRGARGTDLERGRGASPSRPGPVEQGDRGAAGDLAQDGGPPRRAHLHDHRRLQPRRRCAVRGTARAAPGRDARAYASPRELSWRQGRKGSGHSPARASCCRRQRHARAGDSFRPCPDR
jgi:HD-GYP domain-containing protein (c-di-GMP phosphodiesterase class II)